MAVFPCMAVLQSQHPTSAACHGVTRPLASKGLAVAHPFIGPSVSNRVSHTKVFGAHRARWQPIFLVIMGLVLSIWFQFNPLAKWYLSGKPVVLKLSPCRANAAPPRPSSINGTLRTEPNEVRRPYSTT
jgi:hypothetical protein